MTTLLRAEGMLPSARAALQSLIQGALDGTPSLPQLHAVGEDAASVEVASGRLAAANNMFAVLYDAADTNLMCTEHDLVSLLADAPSHTDSPHHRTSRNAGEEPTTGSGHDGRAFESPFMAMLPSAQVCVPSWPVIPTR